MLADDDTACVWNVDALGIPGMVADLRACARSRSGEWIMEVLRADFEKLGMPQLSSDLAFRLGGFLRSQLGPLGPAPGAS